MNPSLTPEEIAPGVRLRGISRNTRYYQDLLDIEEVFPRSGQLYVGRNRVQVRAYSQREGKTVRFTLTPCWYELVDSPRDPWEEG